MCGLCGFLEVTPRSSAAELGAVVRRMADTLAHRGPDGSGTWTDAANGVALGHRRLAVLDLSPEGAQPMRSACGRIALVYNGEIYNHRELRKELEASGHAFRGHSDTEVLAEAISRWGVAGAVERAQGMFAFAAWDARARRLTLARDRLGKKPLYYGRCSGHFLFASELKALRAHPAFRAELNRDALAFFVRFSYVPAPHSIYAGVHKLPAGSLLTLDSRGEPADGGLRSFWSVRRVVESGAADPFRGSAAEAADALEALLRDAVERRMIADVPLGGLLSGGVDSSTVVALMQACSARPVRTFSIGFRESGHDEAPHARRVAAHLGTDHRELTVTPRDALGVIPRLPELYDEPFADVSQIPTFLLARLARSDVTVALSGDGGDESFAGYPRYFRCLRRWRWLSRIPQRARRGLAAALAAGAPVRLEKLADVLTATGLEELFLRMNARCPASLALVPGGAPPRTVLDDPERWPRVADPLQWMGAVDLDGRLRESILVKVDRASMGVALEVRCPLLDARVVEFAAHLPMALKVRHGRGKWLLREVLARHVPAALVDRPKMGFGVPIGAWLRGPLREWAEALLDAKRLRDAGHLDAALVRSLWSQHLSGRRDRRFLLWNLLMFQSWLEASQRVGSLRSAAQ